MSVTLDRLPGDLMGLYNQVHIASITLACRRLADVLRRRARQQEAP
jgi:hypothetical protein